MDDAVAPLATAFGAIETASESMAFDFTHYYDDQMGSPLLRRFVSFAPLVDPSVLSGAKVQTNVIEADFARRLGPTPPRPLNLDVGYVSQSKLVLASMKDFSHRVYLGLGVYAEVTLMYRRTHWEALPWTFPDYASGRYDAFLTSTRQQLRRQLQELEP